MIPHPDENNRILIVDDNPAIHEDFRKILADGEAADRETDDLLSAVLGKKSKRAERIAFELDSAFQGQEGLAKVERALKEGRPYALAFVDVRMPPGWDGVETITHLWSKDPSLQVVICTAYSDYSWQEIVQQLGNSDRLVILKKPFDNIEVLQLAHAMTRKWSVTKQATARFEGLDRLVAERTQELEKLNLDLASEIREREHIQAALRISEERLARAFDACPLPTAILQVTDQKVVQANPALTEATGRALSELTGAPLWDAGIQVGGEFRRTATSRLLRGEALRRHECEFITANHEQRRGLLWLEPFALASGPHVLAVLQDVTDQHKLETQVRQAHKMEAVGHLAAGVAHDFNNLLTIIQGHASMQLRTASLDRRVADSLAAVQQASERASDLTRQLLAFSRKQVMEKGVVSLGTVVTNVSAMLSRLIPESIELQFACTKERSTIYGDRCNIEQVLLNLVVNARDAIQESGHIWVSTDSVSVDEEHVRKIPEARTGPFVRLEVRDTGTGMSEEVLRKIFEPFFTTKEAGKGTGMGLATVHGIVQQHDGWVEVESRPGVGTTFRVYFPFVAATLAPNAGDSRAPEIEENRARHVPAEGRCILLAEDDPDVRSLACGILEESGYKVIEAADGRAALNLWKEHRGEIAMLVTDMVMPGGLSGADLAKEILAEKPSLPIVFSSGYSSDLFTGDRKFLKNVNYLPKPYLSSDLVDIVGRAFVAAPAKPAHEPAGVSEEFQPR